MGRTVVLGDLHVGVNGGKPDKAARTDFAAVIEYAKSFGAQLLIAGDLTDRALVKKTTEETRVICRSTADALHEYCEETLKKVHRVFGNHDPLGQEINSWFPGVYFKHHGAYLNVEDDSGRDRGIFLTHGHLFTRAFRERYLQCMQSSEIDDPHTMLQTVFEDPQVQFAAAHSWSNIVLPPVMKTLQCMGWKDRAERFLFDMVERKRVRKQRMREETTQYEGTYPAAYDQAAWTAECAAHAGHSLGISGHTHRSYIDTVTTSQGKQVTVANAGGWLPSDPSPRSFLEVYDDVVALHSVRENGSIERGNLVHWAQ